MGNRVEEIPEVIDNLRRIFQSINGYFKEAEKETGLTGPQFWALKIMAGNPPMRVSDLAHQMCLRPATVVGILDRLEAKELVIRVRSKQDRRAVNLHLTEAGKTVIANAPEAAQAMLLKGLEGLQEEEFHQVAEGMRHIVHIVGAEEAIPQLLHG